MIEVIYNHDTLRGEVDLMPSKKQTRDMERRMRSGWATELESEWVEVGYELEDIDEKILRADKAASDAEALFYNGGNISESKVKRLQAKAGELNDRRDQLEEEYLRLHRLVRDEQKSNPRPEIKV